MGFGLTIGHLFPYITREIIGVNAIGVLNRLQTTCLLELVAGWSFLKAAAGGPQGRPWTLFYLGGWRTHKLVTGW